MYLPEATVRIDRPMEEVFDFVADSENDPLWCIPVIETTRIAGDAPGLNARYTFAAETGRLKPSGELEAPSSDHRTTLPEKGSARSRILRGTTS